MSTQILKTTAVTLGAAGIGSIIYAVYANTESDKYIRKHEYTLSDNYETKSYRARWAAAGLFASSLILYRQSPLSRINRATSLIEQQKLLAPQVTTIITSSGSTAEKLDQLTSFYVVSKVPLSSASKDLNERLSALISAKDLVNSTSKSSCTKHEKNKLAELQKKIESQEAPLHTFMVEFKKTPEYVTAMTLQSHIDHTQAATNIAAATAINAGANMANATRAR